MSVDHPVFNRLSRAERVIRRRSVGIQALVFNPSAKPSKACKVCNRRFELYWNPFLCHICGLWTCVSCSSVIECERVYNTIQFVRCCANCIGLLNSPLPCPDQLADFAFSPWVIESSKCSLGLNLAEVIQTKKKWRQAAVELLVRFGQAVGCCADLLDNVSEDDWQCTSMDSETGNHHTDQYRRSTCWIGGSHDPDIQKLTNDPRYLAQYLIQQCYELRVDEPLLEECRFAEHDGRRRYPLEYNSATATASPPDILNEEERVECLARYGLVERYVNTEIIQLVCYLAGKELNCKSAAISTLFEDSHILLTIRKGELYQTINRSTGITTYSCVYDLPFLVRNTHLDIRFRNLPLAKEANGIGFLFTMPIHADTGDPFAMLVVFDATPRTSVTTTEFAVVQRLTDLISQLLTEQCLRPG